MKNGFIIFSGICLAVLAACGPATVEAPRGWKIIGPGGGGSQYYPTISPHDSRRVMVGCDMTGSYITHDAGASWRMFNLGWRARSFVFDPVVANMIYVVTGAIWRSRDDGETWRLVYPHPARVTGVVMLGDHALGRMLTTGPAPGYVTALAVDPADPAKLFAAVRLDGRVGLRVSSDAGESWQEGEELPDGARKIWVDGRSPRDDRTLYVAGENAVAVRECGAWRTGAAPAERLVNVTLGLPANDDARPLLYATTARGIFYSEDGGASWNERPFVGETARFRGIATSRFHPETVYVSYGRLELEGDTWLGVAVSNDRGQSWELAWKDSRKTGGANINRGWLAERFGPTWGSNPFTLGVADDDPLVCYGTDFGRTMRTLDGGKTWKAMYSRRHPAGGWTSTGLDVTTNYGVHFDPFDAKRIFITYTDIGMFGSDNGGASWTSATIGVPRKWVNTTYWVVFDPAVKGRVWAVVSGTHDLPRPKMWQRRDPETFTGGVVVSDDGARTWRVSNEGMAPETAATHILLDPESPAKQRVLYVAAYGRGVYKSEDGGKSWSLKNSGIEGEQPFAWRFARDREGVLYLVVARRSDDGSIGNELDGALYRSRDGAESWEKLTLPEGVNGPNGLAIDPDDPKRLYLAAWARATRERPEGGGIFLSTDAGATWRMVHGRDQHVYDVTIDPRDAKVLYATGFESSAWRSADRGETWTRIPGYNFKWGHRVIPDPHDAGMIYITTFGGSVWHGPAEGTPGAVEDVVTEVVKPGRDGVSE